MLSVTLILLAKTNYIPSSFTWQICPHFCHTYICVEGALLTRCRRSVLTQAKIKAGKPGWFPASVPRITPYRAEWGEKNVLCWCGLNFQGSPVVVALAAWCSEEKEALPVGMVSDSVVEKSLTFILFSFLSCSLTHSSGAFQQPQQQLTPLGAQSSCALLLAGTWGCPESGEEEQLCCLWVDSFSCPCEHAGVVCAVL